MPLTPGTRLGPYEIVSLLGAGGMGEVYRARDSRLGRDVAIKALPASLAHDADRLARFEREARLLASLNHPNIAAIYGLEEAGGQRYLVLEYVEGETLARRLEKGPPSLDETLHVCRVTTSIGAMFTVVNATVGGIIIGLVYFSDLARRFEPGSVERVAPAGTSLGARA